MNFKYLLKKYNTVLIPRIQRDYAQGRIVGRAPEIRTELLNDIFAKDSLSLNIVFGETLDNIFIPVDGQQRLTTLFLLYLYDYKIHGSTDPGLKKFSYDTRQSTKDFVNELISREWNIESIRKCGSVSEYIKNEIWYVWPWQYNPTVQGMLTMLDAIHQMAESHKFPTLDNISFDFLDMGDLGLNETLYLKMNSRGKQLTQFEKIKSGFDGLVDSISLSPYDALFSQGNQNALESIQKNLQSFADFWKWEMDRKWIELFWNKETHSQDQQFLSLLRAFTIAFHIGYNEFATNSNGEYFRDDILTDLEDGDISWLKLRSILTENNRESYFLKLSRLLNRLCETSPFFSSLGEKIELNNLKTKPTIRDIAYIWAISEYAGESYSEASFCAWLRFIFNMVHNTVDSFDSLVRFVNRCNNFYAPNSLDINIWLKSNESKDIGDRSEQWQEERYKASVLEEYGSVIAEAEGHPLLEGRIRPILLEISKDSSNIELNAANLYEKFETFNKYFSRTCAKEDMAVFVFRKFFSYIQSHDLLWWKYYVFENKTDVWKNRIFKLENFCYAVTCLLSKSEINNNIENDFIKILCSPGVLERVLSEDQTDWYLRDPDVSLRPYNNKWNGIRLYQNHIKESVEKLLNIGCEFSNKEQEEFYNKYNLVWGVRIEMLYNNRKIQLWDNCDLWLVENQCWLCDENQSQIRIYQYNGDLKALLDIQCS